MRRITKIKNQRDDFYYPSNLDLVLFDKFFYDQKFLNDYFERRNNSHIFIIREIKDYSFR